MLMFCGGLTACEMSSDGGPVIEGAAATAAAAAAVASKYHIELAKN